MIVLKCRRNGGDLLAFGPDSRMLAARSETGLQLWRDIHSGAKPTVFRELTSTASIQFTPDGEAAFIDGSESGVLDLRTGRFDPSPDPEGYRFSSLSADCKTLLVVSLPRVQVKNRIECWPATSPLRGRPLWRSRLKRPFAGRPISLEDGRFILEEEDSPGTRQYRYVVRSGHDGAILSESDLLGWFSERDAASPDSNWLVGQHTNELRIWNLNEMSAPPLRRSTGSKKIFTDVAFHPSSRWLAVTSTDETVKFFDTTTWQVCRTYSWGLGKMIGIAFSPDGLLAAAGSDKGRIVIWDVEQ